MDITDETSAPSSDPGDSLPPKRARRAEVPAWAGGLVLGVELFLLFAGQAYQELLTMDDLREAEVARAMALDRNFIIPHLAGLPFVEKPPGFQFVIAVLFILLGGPSILAARLVAAGFALLALVAVYLLGRRALGSPGAIVASALLAFCPLFITVSHEILLDNALLATMAFGLYFAWMALSETDLPKKRKAYAGAAFSLALGFLVKGLTGPALAAAGMILYLVLSRQWSELRSAFHVLPLVAFLAPLLVWLIPFLVSAPRDLVAEFFIKNHLGRFLSAYASHPRPPYFYLETIWYKFAPGAIFLPFAGIAAFLDRRKTEGRDGLIFLSFSAGPFLLLSLSRAKDAVYLLPAYPALCLLASGWCLRAFSARPSPGWTGMTLSVASVGAAVGAVIASWRLGGPTVGLVLAAGGLLCLVVLLLRSLKGKLLPASLAAAGLWAGASLLFVSGPVAEYRKSKLEWREAVPAAIREAEGKDLLLYLPDDETRGACGFYRRRAAEEVNDPEIFVRRLSTGDALGVLQWPGPSLPAEILRESTRLQIPLKERLRMKYYGKHLILISAGL